MRYTPPATETAAVAAEEPGEGGVGTTRVWTVVSFVAWCCVASWGGLGCGARSAIDKPDHESAGGVGGAVSVATSSSASGGGDGGEGGAGGAPLRCESVAWVGEPVTISLGGSVQVERPFIARTSATSFGVAYGLVDVPVGPFTTLGSFAVTDPFGAWPPAIGTPNVNFPTGERYAFIAGEPGEIGFAAADAGGAALALGGFVPGENGSSFLTLPIATGPVLFAARSGLGAYLIGTGDPGALYVDHISSFSVGAEVTSLGSFGCGDSELMGAASALTNADAFWVASSSDQPFDDCIDPDLPGPALFAQVARVSSEGRTPLDATSTADVVTEIDVAATAASVWTGVGVEHDYLLYADGVGAAPVAILSTELVTARHTIARLGEQVVVVQLVPADQQPGGELTLFVASADGQLLTLPWPTLPPFALSEPAVSTDDDGRILVAFVTDQSTLVLARADCAR